MSNFMESDAPFGLRYSESMNTTVIDMATPLDPLISEFDTAEEADAYDRWFRAEVEASLAETGPGIPHDQVMAEMDAIIVAAEERLRAKQA
jgi:hypothetical protein